MHRIGSSQVVVEVPTLSEDLLGLLEGPQSIHVPGLLVDLWFVFDLVESGAKAVFGLAVVLILGEDGREGLRKAEVTGTLFEDLEEGGYRLGAQSQVIESPAEICPIHWIIRIELHRPAKRSFGIVVVISRKTNAVVSPGKARRELNRPPVPLSSLVGVLGNEKDVRQSHHQGRIVGVGLEGNPERRFGIAEVVLSEKLFPEKRSLTAGVGTGIAAEYDSAGLIGQHSS